MNIKSLKKTDYEVINSSTNKDIAKRLVFLWDLREDNFDTYSKNGLATEKEFIYRNYQESVVIAQGV